MHPTEEHTRLLVPTMEDVVNISWDIMDNEEEEGEDGEEEDDEEEEFKKKERSFHSAPHFTKYPRRFFEWPASRAPNSATRAQNK